MNAKKETGSMVAVGAVACAACCAGPILGFLATIGLGTAAGMAKFGGIALFVGAAAVAIVLRRRQKQRQRLSCASTEPQPVTLTR